MFLKYIDFVFQPFRSMYNRFLGYKNIKGNIQIDINRSKALVRRGGQHIGNVNQKINQWGQQPQQGAQAMQPGQGAPGMTGMQPPPGMPGAPPAPGAPNPNPGIRTTGFWIFKKKF